MDAFVFGVVALGGIPFDEELTLFSFDEYRQVGNPLVRVGDDAFQ